MGKHARIFIAKIKKKVVQILTILTTKRVTFKHRNRSRRIGL